MPSWLAGVPALVVILICSVLPLAWMALVILSNPAVRDQFMPSAFRMTLLGRTLAYNAGAAIIAAAMGIPAAYVLGRGRGLLARVLWVVIPSALLMPSLSYAYGWSQFARLAAVPLGHFFSWFFQPGSDVLRKLGFTLIVDQSGPKSFLIPNGPPDVFRCIWSLGTWLWAVPAVLVGLALRRLETGVQQHAVLDGALHRVTFRQLLGPIIASMAIVTILATQEFSVYEPTGISVVATEVRMVFDTGAMSSASNSIVGPGFQGGGARSPDQQQRAAAALATDAPLLAVTILLAIIAAWGASATSTGEALSPGDWPPVLDVSPWTVGVTVGLILLNIGVPVACLLVSLHSGFSPARMWKEFGPQVNGAIAIASEAAVVGLVAAFFIGVSWIPGSLAIMGASFLVGGQLLAIGLIRIYNRPWLEWAYDSWVIMVIAYVGRFGWIAVAAGKGTWSRPWRELRDMASVDGATPLRAARSIVWPVAWPTLLAGALLVGALSLTEVPATVLLMPQNPPVLTPILMTWVHMVRYDPMIEASLLMMGTVLVPAVAAILLTSFGMRVFRRDVRAGRSPRDGP